MNIDCGNCPNVTSGCLETCMKAEPRPLVARPSQQGRTYEALVQSQAQVAALREELAAQKETVALFESEYSKQSISLTAAEQRNVVREDLLNQCMHAFNHVVGFSDQATRTAWYANFLKPVSGAIMVHLSECAKPTESGASE